MAEVGISIAAKVAEYLVQPIIRQGQYLFCANKFLKKLEDKKKELMSTQDIVLKQVEEAKSKTERIEDVVQKWLTEVQTLLEEVEKLEQQVKANNSCFQGRSPTWRRYHLCKEMMEKTKVMMEFDNKSNFKTFAPLQDDGVYRIALFGLGGSGKTTLVTEVGKKAKESNLFDRVVAVTVSQTPNVRNIQGQMADMLNFKLEEETEKGRAQRLYMRLKEEKRILIIVDDVWGEFNLKDIGIDFDICHSGSCLQGLKVMVLNRTMYNLISRDLSLPPSIESLTNLQTLCLRRWNLGDISFLIKLKKLEVLELKSCVFNELPNEIANLNKLKLLDLSECAALSENYEAIGELSEIE
ncbi:hypothetical protein L6164_017208 [Bauhinia variegata]|uniref:Uncharacterized protein n=1 Tax=Bauhinia variegata TaxID=167791 RepID=A0ACB9N7S8_BAUVA|nr:hypothetical protein L6164_017208 [Bauhinia variegata]